MKAGPQARAVFIGLAILLLSSCTQTGGFGSQSFKAQYVSARTALETGDYQEANRLYARLLPDAGPLRPRIKLEHAHSHLRAGDFDAAAEMADALARAGTGSERGAALAVLGTAEHEAALKALVAGDLEVGTMRMMAAQKALQEVISAHPDLDPLGSLAGRSASIDVRIKSLR